MSDYAIRTARESDFEIISAAIDTWWDSPGLDTEAARRERAALVPRLWLQHFFDTSFVALDGDELAGFLIGFVSPGRPDEAYIHFVGVRPDARRAGLGRTLYERFFRLARERERSIVRAITSPPNTRSIAFHRAMGFDIEEPTDDYDGVRLARVKMTRYGV